MISSRIATAIVAAMLALAPWGNSARADVSITYKQIANFGAFRNSPGSDIVDFSGKEGVFTLYKVISIANNNATPFVFNPDKIETYSSVKTSHGILEASPALLGDQYLGTPTTGAKQTVKYNLCFITFGYTKNDMSKPNPTSSFKLLYNAPGVAMKIQSSKVGIITGVNPMTLPDSCKNG